MYYDCAVFVRRGRRGTRQTIPNSTPPESRLRTPRSIRHLRQPAAMRPPLPDKSMRREFRP
ncbi:hypothetical protein EXIGLDRAFT_95389 [Exidia glandulosa HHB12029]|uniref:Uncharacterized protein n=1 Tax=Exidia glandulosa HHB12029 TaxID=1314781 RepID=A0A166MEE8_EXIGL|nr:hypothetical protein EXIGLDRAFT_95389 [Exidia glandulosa HHB12029]